MQWLKQTQESQTMNHLGGESCEFAIPLLETHQDCFMFSEIWLDFQRLLPESLFISLKLYLDKLKRTNQK